MWLVSLAGYWQGASVLHHVACLRILLTWRLMSLRVSDPREKTQCLFLDLASEVTLSFLPYPAGYTDEPHSLREETTQACDDQGGKNHQELS